MTGHEQLISEIGWGIIHFTWQASLIALFAMVILKLSRKDNANFRYMVCCISLLLMIILPIVTVALNYYPESNEKFIVTATNSNVNVEQVIQNEMVIATRYKTEEISLTTWEKFLEYFDAAIPFITLFWILGVLIFCIYHLTGMLRWRHQIMQNKQDISSDLKQRINLLIEKLGIRQKFNMIQSVKIDIPTVYGWFKPTLIIPVSFFTGMDQKYIDSIILHELAHIKRYDYLVNMFQILMETIGFFHPAVWWISGKIRQEREHCCDDFAVNILGDRLLYVKSLVQLEETRSTPALALAANGGELMQRVSRILNYTYKKSFLTPFYSLFIILGLFCFLTLTGFTYIKSNQNTVVEDIVSTKKDMKEHLVAYFPFDGSTKDMSPQRIHGYNFDAQLTTDRFGIKNNAYDFNGIDQRIIIKVKNWPRKKSNPEGSLTLSSWIYPRSVKNKESWISRANFNGKRSQWRAGFGGNGNDEWGLTEFIANKKEKKWNNFLVTNSEIPLNQWTHIAMVADQERKVTTLYKNGKKIAEIGNLKPFTIHDKSPLFIGFQPCDREYFDGKIDEVQIYDCALSEQAIEMIYQMN